MSQIQIVTSPTCSYCHAAKNLFDREGVDYQEIDLFEHPEAAQALIAASGQRTVPQIFINEKPIGGYTELTHLLHQAEFDLQRLSDF